MQEGKGSVVLTQTQFHLSQWVDEIANKGSCNRLQIQQVTNLDAVVQVRPVNRKTAGFKRPIGALLRRGFGQPLQSRHFGERHADFPAIVEPHMQRVRGDARTLGVDLFSGFSGQSIHAGSDLICNTSERACVPQSGISRSSFARTGLLKFILCSRAFQAAAAGLRHSRAPFYHFTFVASVGLRLKQTRFNALSRETTFSRWHSPIRQI